jgi:choline dehydrogenase-like flavoprotein
MHGNPNVRNLPEDYPINTDDSSVDLGIYNAVGGGTVHWSADWPRFHPSDFKARTLDGVAADWPLTYEQLEPYYDLNHRTVGVAGLAGDPAYPPKSPRQAMPLPLGKPAETLARGFDELG